MKALVVDAPTSHPVAMSPPRDPRIKRLLSLLKKATEGTRELDGAIWAIVAPDDWLKHCWFKGSRYAGHRHTAAEKRKHALQHGAWYAPHYTTSLDAALTLVPDPEGYNEAWGGTLTIEYDCGKGWYALLGHCSFDALSSDRRKHPALALCTVAIEARSIGNQWARP